MRYDPLHLVRELRRRHVVRMTVAYLIASFALLEAADVLKEPLDLPTTMLTALVWILALGLAPVIVLTWIYELTPEGVRRTVGWHDDDAGHTITPASPSGEAPAVRLLVLPFRILRPDAETDYIAFALPDAIACALMGLRSLTVRSSLAAAQVAREPDPASVAATADVDVILSGTVVRAGAALRISAQLASAADGALLWAQNELVEVDSLFEHQDALARRIVHSLAVPTTDASDIGYLGAVALAALGRDTEAVDWLLAQPTVDDAEGSGLYLRSLLTLLQDRRDEAVALTTRVLSTLTDGESRFYMTRQLARAGAHSAAIQELKRVVDSGFTPVRAFAEDPWLESVRAAAGFDDVLDGARQRQRVASQLLLAHGGSSSLHARVLSS